MAPKVVKEKSVSARHFRIFYKEATGANPEAATGANPNAATGANPDANPDARMKAGLPHDCILDIHLT